MANDLGIAGEHPAARAPPVRNPDRVGAHAPADAVPVHAHRVQHTVGVANVKDVRVAIGEERALLAASLLLYEGDDLGEIGLGLGLATEFSDDELVQRATVEDVIVESTVLLTWRAVGTIARGDGLAHARPLGEEAFLEVVSDVGYLHRRVLFEIDCEEIADGELRRQPELDGAGEGEKRFIFLAGQVIMLSHFGVSFQQTESPKSLLPLPGARDSLKIEESIYIA